jgi:predicted DCC family thiol-disulfide oxidoreductase YuxK
MARSTPSTAGLTVWIDGSCQVCRRSERWCSSRDVLDRIRFQNVHDTTVEELPRAEDEMLAAVHVVTAEGDVLTGFDGWRRILGELPGWRWFGRVSGWPIVRHLGRLLYRVIAANRHRAPLSRNSEAG